MFDKQLKRKYKNAARKKAFITSFITTNVVAASFLLVLAKDQTFHWEWLSFGLILSMIVSPFYAMWSNMTKKQYFKLMQKHIMENIAMANDALEIQRMQVAMTYYGNQMNATQMQEIKAAAAAASSSHASAHASAHAQVNVNTY